MIVKKFRYFRGYKFSRVSNGGHSCCELCDLFKPSYSYCDSCTAVLHLRRACRGCENDMLYFNLSDNSYRFIPTKHVIKEI